MVITLEEDIVLNGVVPEPLNSRGYLGLTKKDLKMIQSSMVVVYLPFFWTSFCYFYRLLKCFLGGGGGMVNRPKTYIIN